MYTIDVSKDVGLKAKDRGHKAKDFKYQGQGLGSQGQGLGSQGQDQGLDMSRSMQKSKPKLTMITKW